MGMSGVHAAARELARRLREAHIDHAIVEALALGVHGFRRATEDVDVLVSREGLARFKAAWLGRGYLELRPGGRAVRDTQHGIRIDFLIAGEYPGDGLPKPVAFPDPAAAALRGEQYHVLDRTHLIELKLASAMTAPHRGHDFFDIVHLVRRTGLPLDLGSELDPFVRDKYAEAWRLAQIDDD